VDHGIANHLVGVDAGFGFFREIAKSLICNMPKQLFKSTSKRAEEVAKGGSQVRSQVKALFQKLFPSLSALD